MIGLQLILTHHIVYVTEMSSKMASTLSQKWLTIFFIAKQSTILYISYHNYDIFYQISPACGTNAYQTMYGETLNVSLSNGNIKCVNEKIFFAVNLHLKPFCVMLKLTLEV